MTPPDGALGERAPPLTQLRSGYALPTLRQRRRVPILIDTQFSPQNSLAPRGSLLGAKGGRDWKRFDIGGDVMQQCREPYSLALSRRLAHGCQSVRRGIPAQCPGRGRLTAVPLGRGPSLHGLRRGNALVVRPLHRYYSLVRLLIRIHAHRSAFAFMGRSGMPCRTRMRPPRFRAENFSTRTRSPTARGSSHASHSP